MDNNLVSAGLGEGFVLLDSLNGASDYFEVEDKGKKVRKNLKIVKIPQIILLIYFILVFENFLPRVYHALPFYQQNKKPFRAVYFVLFTCFGLYLWLKVHYKKKAKIVTDARYSSMISLISMGFDRGMVIFVLGFTHQMLLNVPTTQIFVLLLI